jgi:hypothetical protein
MRPKRVSPIAAVRVPSLLPASFRPSRAPHSGMPARQKPSSCSPWLVHLADDFDELLG